jgi:hypothetical protein
VLSEKVQIFSRPDAFGFDPDITRLSKIEAEQTQVIGDEIKSIACLGDTLS